MRIGIDACCWSNRRGFGRYTRELVAHMIGEPTPHEFILVVDRATAEQYEFPPGATLEIVDTREQPTVAAAAEGSRSPLDLWRMSRAASRLRADLFYFPAVYSFYPILSRIPTIVTFHDAIAESHPDLIFPSRKDRLFWNIKMWLALRQADRLLTVSQSAKAQIIETFGYPESDIHVILEGPGPEFRVIQDRCRLDAVLARHKLPQESPLLLYVGGISPHKNLQGLLQALDDVRRGSSEAWHMVIVGDYSHDSFYGCFEELVGQCKELDLTDRVTFTGYVSNDDLVALYNAATALVLPSFDEGFGLPVVEAMTCGLPVAASRRGSLPEIIGSAGLLFDPNEPSTMATAITRLLKEPELRDRLKTAGLERAEQFSWKKAAREAINLFESVAGHVVATA